MMSVVRKNSRVKRPTDIGKRRSALSGLAKHFMASVFVLQSATEQKTRHQAMEAELAEIGAFDLHDVLWLFYELEQQGMTTVNKIAALAQTTEPETLLKHGLPHQLVSNANIVKEHHQITTKRNAAQVARSAKLEAQHKMDFMSWIQQSFDSGSGTIQVDDVRAMSGFKPAWGITDVTLKKWVKEAYPGFRFKPGAKKKK